MAQILIADDHALVRAGLHKILEEGLPPASGIEEVANGDEMMQALTARQFDVIVLDISMPGKTGLELLQELRRDYPRTAVLVLSVHPEKQYAVRALKGGAAGYLTKDAAPESLVEAVTKACAGGRYVSPSLAELLATEIATPDSRAPHELLSNREDAIFRRLAAGISVGQIAKAMGLSVKTVSTYRARVLAKMKMKTNAQLMRYAVDHKLVD
jgi:two-component system, NarL family, invasion response regulator UvrY